MTDAGAGARSISPPHPVRRGTARNDDQQGDNRVMRSGSVVASRRAGRLGLAILAAALVALPSAVSRPISDPSPWLHLLIGRYLDDGHRFGLPDPWAPYAARAYVPTQWLPSMLTAAVHERVGDAVVVWERSAGIAVLAVLVLLWGMRLGRTGIAAPVAVAVVLASWTGLTERPQLLGFILLVPVLQAWATTARDRRPRWWLVPLTWLAAASHGIWSTGLAVGGVTVLAMVASRSLDRRAAVRLLALLAACTAAAAATPIGPRLLLTPFSVGSLGRRFVAEWQASSVRSPQVLLALALLGLAWLGWVLLRRRPDVWELAWLVVGLGSALSMQRTVPVAAFLAVPLVVPVLDEAWARSRAAGSRVVTTRRHGGTTWLLAAATAAGLLLAVPVANADAGQPVRGVPTRLTAALAAYPDGTRVIAAGDLTGWLLFEAPGLRPVEDLRVEVYSAPHVTAYIDTMAADRGWSRFIEQTDPRIGLLASDSPLLAALQEERGWVVRDRDHGYVLVEAPT